MGTTTLHATTAQQIGLRTAAPIAQQKNEHAKIDKETESPATSIVRGADSVEISAQARSAAAEAELSEEKSDTQKRDKSSETGEGKSGPSKANSQSELSEEEQKQVTEMQQRDREVRAHENAHKAAAGSLAKGGPTYTTQRGPDGKQYATGGEVNIQLSKGSSPEQTLRNSRQAQQAATAPADPSSQDRKVAAMATAMASEARREIAAAKKEDGKLQSTAGAAKNTSADLSGGLPGSVLKQGDHDGHGAARMNSFGRLSIDILA